MSVFWVHAFQRIQGAPNVHMESLVQAEAPQASLGCLLNKTCAQVLLETEKADSLFSLTFPHSFLSQK